MKFRNNIFISYAKRDKLIAKELEKEISKTFPDSFKAELVEDRKAGDETFTEKVEDSYLLALQK